MIALNSPLSRLPGLLDRLPPPPPARTGWPWTEETDAAPAAERHDWPRITLVTPSFNQGAFIEETIRSVLLQNYPNLEYIVIDGGSTDGTVAILQRYSPWLTCWVSEPDRGQSDAVNKGLARASGAWFNWINSDDYLLPGALHALAGAATPDALIISGRTRNIGEGGAAGTYAARFSGDMPGALFNLGVNQPGSLLRLAAVRSGMLCEHLHYTMDLELWLRLLLQGGPSGLVQSPAAVATYRYHAESKTCSGHQVFAAEELALLLDLARALAAGPLPAALGAVRERLPVPVSVFDKTSAPPWPRDDVMRALLDRLIVSDSLLFRGLWRATGDRAAAMHAFRPALSGVADVLARQHGPQARVIRAQALLHAMEAGGRFSVKAGLEAFRLAPSFRLLRACLRLLMRRSPR